MAYLYNQNKRECKMSFVSSDEEEASITFGLTEDLTVFSNVALQEIKLHYHMEGITMEPLSGMCTRNMEFSLTNHRVSYTSMKFVSEKNKRQSLFVGYFVQNKESFFLLFVFIHFMAFFS